MVMMTRGDRPNPPTDAPSPDPAPEPLTSPGPGPLDTAELGSEGGSYGQATQEIRQSAVGANTPPAARGGTLWFWTVTASAVVALAWLVAYSAAC